MGPFGFPRFLGLFLLLTGVAALAYNLGAASGLAPAGGAAVAAPVVAPLFFGFFGFLFFGFLLKLLFIGLLVRLAVGFFWRGRRGPWGGWGDRRRFGEDDLAYRFEELHRRSHDSTGRETTL